MFVLFLVLWACLPAGCTSLTSPTPGNLSSTPTATLLVAELTEARAVIVTGMAVPDVWAGLSFRRNGVVESILVEEGQQVAAGQVIIHLQDDDLKLAVAQAEAALATAQARLAQLKAPPRREEIALAQAGAAVATAQARLALLKAPPRQEEIAAAQAEAAVATAQARLAQLKAPPGQEEIAVAQAIVDQAQANLEASRARLANAEDAVGAAEADLNASRAALTGFEAALNIARASVDQRELQLAQLEIERARNDLWKAYLERDAIAGRPGTPKYLVDVALAAVSNAEATVRSAELEYEQLNTAPNADEIARAQADVSEAQASVAGAEARLAQTQDELDEISAQVDANQASLEQSQAELAVLLSGPTPEEIAVVEAEIKEDELAYLLSGPTPEEIAVAEAEIKEAELAYVLAGPTSEEIAVVEAEIKEAQVGLAIAQASLRQAELAAPFSGTVTEMLVREGESVTQNQQVILLTDLRRLHVESTELDELDITRIEIGAQAEMTFDALPGARLSGQVSHIGLRGASTEEGTRYKVIVQLNEQIPGIRWGMLAQVEIRP